MHFNSSFLFTLLACGAIQVAALPEPTSTVIAEKRAEAGVGAIFDAASIIDSIVAEQATMTRKSERPEPTGAKVGRWLKDVADAVDEGYSSALNNKKATLTKRAQPTEKEVRPIDFIAPALDEAYWSAMHKETTSIKETATSAA
ncbi:hypothetical protein N7492_006842 [Penicillium capsulatum]|uniref:Uncharacterized protein n=1 Tax=Penicillium capsulatum TaxID=69766 RepID=A0A9W9LKR1_9EURO|nr:hypothetical protein N7492_006842 [Penicillium capsulatum]KAJ6116677.1 hypothetical protein N7512_006402 [Penicillium capsulatum]